MVSFFSKFFKSNIGFETQTKERKEKEISEITLKDKERLLSFNMKENYMVVAIPEFSKKTNEYLLSEVKCKEGDMVKKGDVVAVLETRFFSMEFEVFHTGEIRYAASEKSKLKTGDTLFIIE